MNRQRIVTLALLVALALAGCAERRIAEDPAGLAREYEQSAAELYRQATVNAEQTRTAQDASARATSDALGAAATAQALTLEATRWASAVRATATAEVVRATQEAQAREATATQQSIDATATATRAMATATMQAAIAQVEQTAQAAQAVALEATAQAIERESEREQRTLLLTAFGGWALLALAVLLTVLVGREVLPTVKAKLGQVRRDERGDLPLLAWATGEGVIYYDPTRGWGPATVVDAGVSQPLLTPTVEAQDGATKRAQFLDMAKGGRPKPQRAVKRALGAPGRAGGGEWQEIPIETSEVPWPTRVPLSGVLDGPPSYRRLALGVTMHDDGRAEVIRADMTRLVHVAVGGSSGWGKSVFLQSVAYQLATSADPVDLVLVDLEGVTFAPFARCSRLLYPVADTERDAMAIMKALTDELNRRRELYLQYPGVADLSQYNAIAGEKLVPVVALFDEATALLSTKSVEGSIRTLVLRARKYGLWCVLGGQNWKASSLDTAIRDQLTTRVQFKAMSASQSRVLLQQGGAEMLAVPGRALAILPGQDMMKLQAPMVGYERILAELSGSGPRTELPREAETATDDGQAGRIRELAARGASKRQIALEIFGYTGGAAFQAVTDALGSGTTTECPIEQYRPESSSSSGG